MLTDFGCAKYLGTDGLVEDDDDDEDASTHMTKTGKKGTITHMAPEVITAKTVKRRQVTYKPYDGFKADIYSLGVTLFEMVTLGSKPYEAETGDEYL